MSVYLVSSNQSDVDLVTSAAKKANLECVTQRSLAEVCGELSKSEQAIIVIDLATEQQFRAFENALDKTVGLYSGHVNANRFFYILDRPIAELDYLNKSDLVGHCLVRAAQLDESLTQILSELFQAALENRVVRTKGLFLPTEDTTFETQLLSNAHDKVRLLEQIDRTILDVKPRIKRMMIAAVDELLMNAIFDAPVDSLGKRVYAQTKRSEDRALLDRERVEFTTLRSPSQTIFTVKDHFGSLEKNKVIGQHLGKSYSNDEYVVQSTSAGAGLGLAHVMQQSHGLFISCEISELTEVSILFRHIDNVRTYRDQYRLFSIIMLLNQ